MPQDLKARNCSWRNILLLIALLTTFVKTESPASDYVEVDDAQILDALYADAGTIGMNANLNNLLDEQHTSKRSPWGYSIYTNLTAGTYNFGRGVGYITSSTIRPNDVLFEIPFAQIMSLQSASRGRIQALLDANPSLPSTIAISLHLLEEYFLGERSSFYQYISSLPPTSQLHSTIFYHQDELDRLKGSQLLKITESRLQALENYYKALVTPLTSSSAMNPPLFTSTEFTLYNFKWAMGVVWSHALPLDISSSVHGDVLLVPGLDTIRICTADCPPSNVVLDEDTKIIRMYATKEYDLGEEVILSLSDKTSTLQMLNYGFSRPGGKPGLDRIEISILLESNDPLADVKGSILTSNGISPNDSYSLYVEQETALLAEESALLKLKMLISSELYRYKELLTAAKDQTTVFISLRHELAYTRSIVSACRNLLKQYPTSLQDDEDELAAMTPSNRQNSRYGHILHSILLEKHILQHTIDVALRDWRNLVYLDDLVLTSDE